MAQVSTSERVILNGYDLSCYLNKIGVDASRDLKNSDAFCNAGAHTNKKGLLGIDVSAEGFAAFGISSEADVNALFQSAITNDADNLMLFSRGDTFTVGALAVMVNMTSVKYQISKLEAGEIIMAMLSGNGSQVNGTSILEAIGIWLMSQTVTGAVNGTSFDNTAASAGWIAQAHNTDSDGTVTIKIQHSTDNSTWADLITFTAIPSKTAAAQSIDTSTTVRRYVRAIVTAIGGTTNKVSVVMQIGYSG